MARLGVGWPLPAELDDAALEARLFTRAAPIRDRALTDCAYIHRELQRDGVTLQLVGRRSPARTNPKNIAPALPSAPAIDNLLGPCYDEAKRRIAATVPGCSHAAGTMTVAFGSLRPGAQSGA